MKTNLKWVIVISNLIMIFTISVFAYMESTINEKSSFLILAIPLLITTFLFFKLYDFLVKKHRLMFAWCFFITVTISAVFAFFYGNFFEFYFSVALFISQVSMCVFFYAIFFYYTEKHINIMRSDNYSKPVIKKVAENIVYRNVVKGLKDKVPPQAVDQVAKRIAVGAVAGSLAMKYSGFDFDTLTSDSDAQQPVAMNSMPFEYPNNHSDDLISTAMSIADSHLVNFESGNYSVTGSHANDFNPATGLAMTSDYFDAGGDAYGSALNHDSLFAYDNDISSRLDSHSIDHGSSFNSGFDNHHDY